MEGRLNEEPLQVSECAAHVAFQKCADRIIEYRGHLIAPTGRESLKYRDEVRREHVFLPIGVRGQHIKANGIVLIRWVNENHVVNAFRGNAPQNAFDKVTMRIQHGDTGPVLNVLLNQIE